MAITAQYDEDNGTTGKRKGICLVSEITQTQKLSPAEASPMKTKRGKMEKKEL